MRRAWIIGVALLIAACGPSEQVVCGGCPGSSYLMVGIPAVLRHAEITVCVAERPCETTRVREPLRTDGLQYVPLPTETRWSDYDGTRVAVTVRTRRAQQVGDGTFEFTPSDGSVCSCASLVARIQMRPPTPRG